MRTFASFSPPLLYSKLSSQLRYVKATAVGGEILYTLKEAKIVIENWRQFTTSLQRYAAALIAGLQTTGT